MIPSRDAGPALGDAAFRRDIAHALGTPLGSLLLQAELIDYQLRQGKLPQARQTVAHLLADFDGFARMMRSVFSALTDMAESGPGPADPRKCLTEALDELGDDSIHVVFEGDASLVGMAAAAVAAVFRQLVSEATRLGVNEARLVAHRDDDMLSVALVGDGLRCADINVHPFADHGSIALWTVREILGKAGGRMALHDHPGCCLSVMLPLASEVS